MSDIKFKTADNIYSADTDFIGKLYFLTTEEGGRSEITDEIYRPLFKLKDGYLLSIARGQFIFLPFDIFKNENDKKLTEVIFNRKSLI